MSNKNEYHGIQNKGGCYTTLEKSWKYSCPHRNINYSGFSSGINCLCTGMPTERSAGDRALISGKQWPISNSKLGWKN